MAERKGVKSSQLALAWMLAKDESIIPIPGTKRIKYLEENAAAASIRLTKDEIAQLDAARVFPKPIVTRVDPLAAFYPAEDYHQDFLIKHPAHPYIVINDLPKLASFKRLLPALYRAEPVRVPGGGGR